MRGIEPTLEHLLGIPANLTRGVGWARRLDCIQNGENENGAAPLARVKSVTLQETARFACRLGVAVNGERLVGHRGAHESG